MKFAVYRDVLISDIKPYANNARTHSKAQIGQLVKSIKEFGYTNPVLIDEDMNLIAGHGRLEAAQICGMTTIPAMVVSGLTEAQKRALIIADNQHALNAGWDKEKLQFELKSLMDMKFDLDIAGFNTKQLDDLFVTAKPGLIDEDSVPEPPKTAVSKLGDVWVLGEHRIMCGNAIDSGAVQRLLDGDTADVVFTDPPYNTGMDAKKNSGSTRLSHIFNDKFTDEEWQQLMAGFCASYDQATKKDALIYVCLDWRRSHELVPHLLKHWRFTNLIVWDKMVHGLGSDYKYTHEFIHVCKKGKPALANNKNGDAEYQDVWHIQRKVGRDEDHATKKPIELCERAIRHGSTPGQIVLDLFGGSGSTLIACEKVGRRARLMELNPIYVDVTVRRWEEYTGLKATLASND